MHVRKDVVLPYKFHRIHHELFREVGLRSAECSGSEMFEDMTPSVLKLYRMASLRAAVGKDIYGFSGRFGGKEIRCEPFSFVTVGSPGHNFYFLHTLFLSHKLHRYPWHRIPSGS